ncbi:MAG: hypothetical protein AMXMBFR64_08210 [Myxococcales bacterium]
MVMRLVAVAAALAAALGLARCAEDTSETRSLAEVRVLLSSTDLRAGDSLQATVLAEYDDATLRDVTFQVTWASSNAAVLDVSQTGLVHAKAPGTAKVVATYAGMSGELSVAVTAKALSLVFIVPDGMELRPGASQQFTAIGSYDDGSSSDITALATWTSSNETIASVDAGLAIAKSAGPASITAELDGVTSEPVTLTVLGVTLVGIQLDPTTGTLNAGSGETLEIDAIGIFDDGTQADISKVVVWESSDPAIAAVDTNGIVTPGTVAGTAEITAAVGTVESFPAVIVVLASNEVKTVTVEPVLAAFPAGFTQDLTATVTFADGRTENFTTKANWSSTDETIATVDSHGRVTGHMKGHVIIKAEVSGVFGGALLSVTDATITGITLDPPAASLPVGTTMAFKATGFFSDGSMSDVTSRVTWTSTDPAILTVDGGIATALAIGEATIEAALEDVAATADVAVVEAVFDHIAITPPAPTLPVGLTVRFQATGVLTNGTTMDLTESPKLFWTSSAPDIAMVSNAAGEQGTATAFAVGGALIGATFSDAGFTMEADPVLLSVINAELQGIQVTPTSPTLPAGFELRFHATGLYSDGSLHDLSHDAVWTSSAPGVATVSNAADLEGTVSTLLPGSATIRATFGAHFGESLLTVSNAKLVSISVAPPAASVEVGATFQLSATGNFNDGTTMDLTKTAVWSVAPADLGRGVTVSNEVDREGLVTVSPLATPSLLPVTIYATHGTVAGTSAITIVSPTALTAILVTVDPMVIPVGYTGKATATGLYSDGVHAPVAKDITALVTWSPSISGVATVSNGSSDKGTVKGIGPGTVLINACLGAVCANDPGGTGAAAIVTVTACPFVGVNLSPAGALALPKGMARQFNAMAMYDAACGAPLPGYDVTELSLWISSNPAVATVSNAAGTRGLVTASANPPAVTVQISAHFGPLMGAKTLTIIDACVAELTVTPETLSLPVGVRMPFTATAKMTDGSTIDYTQMAVWQVTGALGLVKPGVIQTFPGQLGTVKATAAPTLSCASFSDTSTVTINDAVLTKVAITPASVTLPINTAISLKANGLFSDGTTFELTDMATWTSSNPAVATAQQGGYVIGKASGTAVILATWFTVSGVANINVEGFVLSGLVVQQGVDAACGDFDGAGFASGVRFPLRAIAHYSDGGSEDVTGAVAWSSDKPAFATVDATGMVETKAVGTALIKATQGGISGTFPVKVLDTDLASIEIQPGNGFIMPINATLPFRAFGHYEALIGGILRADTCEITTMASWLAAPDDSIDITAFGLATTTATPTETAIVTATKDGVVAEVHGEVRGACVEHIRLKPEAGTTMLGVMMQFEAEAVLSDGASYVITDSATWSTSNPAVAQVAEGTIVPITQGVVTVSATFNAGAAACPQVPATQTASATLTVLPAALVSIQIACPGAANLWPAPGGLAPGLPPGLATHCTALGLYSDGTTANVTASATWTSSAPNVATVSNAAGSKGRVLTLGAGMAGIGAALQGVTGSWSLQVVGATVDAVTVTGLPTLPAGFSHPFTAMAAYTLGPVTHHYDVTAIAAWASSDTSKATVSDNPATRGLVTALAPTTGPIAITATHMGKVGAQTLQVLAVTMTAIDVGPSPLALAVGQEKQLTATAFTKDSQGGTHSKDVTTQVSWSTTDPAVASVTNTGKVTALGLGAVAIIAQIGPVSGSASIAVEPRCIASLTMAPAATTVPAGVPLTFAVTAHYTSGPTQDVTGDVTFVSTDPARIPNPDYAGWTFAHPGAAPGMVAVYAHLDGGGCSGALQAAAAVAINGATLLDIAVQSDQMQVPVGLSTQFHAIGSYSDGTSYDITRTIDSWMTGKASVAVVSNAGALKGRVTGVGLGTTPIVATQGNISGANEVTVTSATLTSVSVAGLDTAGACHPKYGAASWIKAGFAHPAGGLTTWARALGHYSNGLAYDITDSVTWSSSNPARAAIATGNGSSGRITTGGQAGNVTLTAETPSGFVGSILFTVKPGLLDQLVINPAGADPLVLPLGFGTQLEVVGRFSGAWHCATEDAQYASADTAVATVTDTGWVDSRGLGFAMLTATLGVVNDTILVKVNDATLALMETIPADVSLFVNDTAQLQALAHFSDGTINDVTLSPKTTWFTSNEAVASLTHAKGGVLAVAPGVAFIDACIQGVCAADSVLTTKVTVMAP